MASSSLGTLTLDLVARTGGFVEGMSKSQRSAKKWRKQVEKDLAVVGKAFGAAGIAAAAGAGVVAASAASTSKEMRDLVRNAEAVGSTAEALSTWQYAARDMGIEAGKVGDIFKDVQDKVNDFVRTGGGEAADIFEQLGLKAQDFIGLAPDQAILRISEAMDGLTQGEKIFFMEGLADDASRLIPLLDNNAERFRALAEEGRNFGTIVTSEQAEVAQGFDKMLERAGHMVEGFQTQLGTELAPEFEGVLNWLDEITDGFGGPREAAQAMAKAIVTAMRDSVKGVQTLTEGLEDAYDMYLSIRELEAQAKAIGGTINNVLEGDDTLPDGFMDLQRIQAERARLASGEGIGSDAVASLDRLLEHMESASKSPALPELNENAIAAATNIGILANSVDDAAATMATSSDNLRRQAIGEGLGIEGGVSTEAITGAIELSDAMKGVTESVEDSTEKNKAAADAVKGLEDSSNFAASALDGIGRGDWGKGALPGPGDDDGGMSPARAAIEAGKDLSPYWLQNDDTGRPTWSTEDLPPIRETPAFNFGSIASRGADEFIDQGPARMNSIGQSISQSSGGGGDGGRPTNRGSVHVTVTKDGNTQGGEVEGEDDFIRHLANALSGVAAGSR